MRQDLRPRGTDISGAFRRGERVLISFFLCVFCAGVVQPKVFAQGCAMCYTSAAAAGKAAERSLDLGVLILLVPTLVLFVGVLVFTIRRATAQTP